MPITGLHAFKSFLRGIGIKFYKEYMSLGQKSQWLEC